MTDQSIREAAEELKTIKDMKSFITAGDGKIQALNIAIDILQQYLDAGEEVGEKNKEDMTINPNYRDGFNTARSQCLLILVKKNEQITELKQYVKDISNQIFEWEKMNNIISICSKHQTPQANCDLCNAQIKGLQAENKSLQSQLSQMNKSASVDSIRKSLLREDTIDPLPPYRCLPPIDPTTANVKAMVIHNSIVGGEE